jgi:hypothetical protein
MTDKHISSATHITHNRELLEIVFSIGSVLRLYNEHKYVEPWVTQAIYFSRRHKKSLAA